MSDAPDLLHRTHSRTATRADQTPGEAPGESTSDEPLQPADARRALAKIGLGLATALLLTGASFWAASAQGVYAPAVPVLLAALAIGQMGVHLVFFLHVSSGPEATNNIIALAFGVFVVALVVFGSMVIMADLDGQMGGMPDGMAEPAARSG
ncbi:MAG TPA: cytochrome C oxidase subunit IV family protein [Burkholderiaceae bacterium]|jgi:cytochrome o ubiquinol oxidase operon protein cyoD|nr:cytochrome C oxidase subunit IV family protein [Burkholderiaceae bacterium]